MLVYDKPLFVQMLAESFARAQSFPVTVTKKRTPLAERPFCVCGKEQNCVVNICSGSFQAPNR